jgi:hypothetical protein
MMNFTIKNFFELFIVTGWQNMATFIVDGVVVGRSSVLPLQSLWKYVTIILTIFYLCRSLEFIT